MTTVDLLLNDSLRDRYVIERELSAAAAWPRSTLYRTAGITALSPSKYFTLACPGSRVAHEWSAQVRRSESRYGLGWACPLGFRWPVLFFAVRDSPTAAMTVRD